MIPVIINNRNLLTWPKMMLAKIQSLKDVGDIIILDNGSDYEPLLEWYNTRPCEIIKIRNLGHTAPWDSGLVDKINSRYYVVTDPDMGIDELPNDTLSILKEKLQVNPELGKIGLGLIWKTVQSDSPYYNHLQSYEKMRWENSKIKNGVYIDVLVDTTFALYNRPNYFIGGGSLPEPYVARHYPWEFTELERSNHQEFSYYLKSASTSSSYKTYLGL